MKVALLYPGITIDGFAKNGQRPITGWIHHGLCHISSVLKKSGHDALLIDLRQLFGWEELQRMVRDMAPDIVGITLMSLDFDAAVKAAEMIKKVKNSIKVIMGGAHPTLMESELIDNKNVDYIFKGEAEVTLPRILSEILNGNVTHKVIKGEIPDLEKIPHEDRRLFKILEAPIVPFLKMPFITAIAGRGCTYNCSFCQPAERIMFGPRLRRMSVEKFIDGLGIAIDDMGFNSLMIHDDCLLEDTKWVELFLKHYSKRGFRKSFVCQSRVDIIVKYPKLLKSMRKYGLEMLLIGFESGSQRVLNFLRKGIAVEQNYKAADICKNLGIRIWANFMLGIPTETKEDVLKTVSMIKRIKPYVSSPAFFTPHPGSDLFEFCIKNDISLIKRHEDYKRYPEGRKIKGIDYDFLNKALEDAVRVPYAVKIRRKIDRLRLGRFNKEFIKNYAFPH